MTLTASVPARFPAVGARRATGIDAGVAHRRRDAGRIDWSKVRRYFADARPLTRDDEVLDSSVVVRPEAVRRALAAARS